MSDAQPISVDVSALIDADWPEWRSALEDIRREYGDEGVRALLRRLQEYSIDQGVTLSDALLNTPYINTLSPEEQPSYPGDLELEKRLENIIRWNAAAMILRAQDEGAGLGWAHCDLRLCRHRDGDGLSSRFQRRGPGRPRPSSAACRAGYLCQSLSRRTIDRAATP